MVLRGQFLERPTLVPVAEGLVLEAMSHRGTLPLGVLVLPPPPAEGGGMDHVVGAELAYALTREGYPTLRFNYRGVGASQGPRASSPAAWLEDARAALALLVDNCGGAAAVAVSIGASDAVALRLHQQGLVRGALLVSPTVVEPRDVLGASGVEVVVGTEDRLTDVEAWARAADEGGAPLHRVPHATRAFQRNLPLVGKAAVAFARVLADVEPRQA